MDKDLQGQETLLQEFSLKMAGRIKEMAYEKMAQGIMVLQLDEMGEVLGAEYIKAIRGILGNALNNLLVTCSLKKSELLAHSPSPIPKETERSLRHMIKRNKIFNIDFVVFVQNISKFGEYNLSFLDELFSIYQGLDKNILPSQINRFHFIRYLADLGNYCEALDLIPKNIIINEMYLESDHMKALNNIFKKLFVVSGTCFQGEIIKSLKNEFNSMEDIELDSFFNRHMMSVVPWKKNESYFKERVYRFCDMKISRFDDVNTIKECGIKMSNCLEKIEEAMKFLDKQKELFIVSYNKVETLFEISFYKDEIYLENALERFNEEAHEEVKSEFYKFLKGIVIKENIPYEINNESFDIEVDDCEKDEQGDLFYPSIEETMNEVSKDESETARCQTIGRVLRDMIKPEYLEQFDETNHLKLPINDLRAREVYQYEKLWGLKDKKEEDWL